MGYRHLQGFFKDLREIHTEEWAVCLGTEQPVQPTIISRCFLFFAAEAECCQLTAKTTERDPKKAYSDQNMILFKPNNKYTAIQT